MSKKKKRIVCDTDFEGGNQVAMYEMVKDGVTGLLSEGHSLQGEFDENVGLKSLFKSPMISLG
jgi:hypothetical protein